MKKPISWKTEFVTLLIFVATAITAEGQTFTTLDSFNGANGEGPYQAALVQGEDGNLYGTTYGGGTSNGGTVFRITNQGTLTTLYGFCGLPKCIDGDQPSAGLTLAVDGNFYGTTLSGGANGWGAVLR